MKPNYDGKNTPFGQYARSSSFNLALSEAQIGALLLMKRFDNHGDSFPHIISLNVRTALMVKGLVEQSRENSFYCVQLTPAGDTVCDLLRIAGYEEEPRDEWKDEEALQKLEKLTKRKLEEEKVP